MWSSLFIEIVDDSTAASTVGEQQTAEATEGWKMLHGGGTTGTARFLYRCCRVNKCAQFPLPSVLRVGSANVLQDYGGESHRPPFRGDFAPRLLDFYCFFRVLRRHADVNRKAFFYLVSGSS